jgi:CRP-like cAMP-binding protein
MYIAAHNNFSTLTENGVLSKPIPETQEHIRKLKASQPIFYEGDAAKMLYQVMEGVVRTYKLTVDGRRQVVSFSYPGDIVGISNDGFHHNHCDAISDVVLQSLHLKDDVQFANKLLQYTVAEITHMQEHFLLLGRKSAVEKVATFLNVLQMRIGKAYEGKTCFVLPMKRMDIADFLGLTTETVSRCFTKLRQDGVISLPHPHQICICNLTALKSLIVSDV